MYCKTNVSSTNKTCCLYFKRGTCNTSKIKYSHNYLTLKMTKIAKNNIFIFDRKNEHLLPSDKITR